MRKPAYCAQCGQEIIYGLKSIPSAGVVVTLIEPHTCLKETAENPYKDANEELILKPKSKKSRVELDKMFEDFDFAKTLGGEVNIPTTTVFDRGSGDKRPKEILRENSKVSSLAPEGVLNSIKNSNPSSPENDMKEID
jgi:hypothetical protein